MRSSDQSPENDSLVRVGLRFVVFCVPLVLMWLVLEWLMAKVPNSHSTKRDQLQAMAGEIDTLITGSSNAYFGIVPALLSGSAYNLANTSETLYYTDQILTMKAPDLPKLRRVIIVVSYISLYFQFRRDEFEESRQFYYQREWHIPPLRPEDRVDIRMWSRVALTDWHLIAENMQRAWASFRTGSPLRGVPGMNDSGWWTERIGTVDPSPEAALVALGRHHSLMHEDNVPGNLAALEHVLTFLEQQKVEVTLLVMPVWHTYAEGMDQVRWLFATAAYERLAQKFGARYLDFLQSTHLPRECFFDADHLNPTGASRFTEMLNTVLEKPQDLHKPAGS